MPDPAPNEPKPEKAIVPEIVTPKTETASPEFDALAFWIQYRGLIKRVCAVVLLAAASWGGYELMQYRKRTGSEQALAASKNPDDLRKVIAEWEGTPSAGSAHLLLASELRAKGSYDESAKVLNDFAAKYPTHTLIPESIVSLGVTLESAGKLDEAIEAYKRAAAYPASPLTPAALVFQARVLVAKGKQEEAKKILTDAQTKYKESTFTMTLGNELLQDLNNPNGLATGGTPRPNLPPPPPPAKPAPAPGAPAPVPGTPAATPPAPATPTPAPATPAPAAPTSPAPAPAPTTPAPAAPTPATPTPATPAPAAPATPAAPAPAAPTPATPAPAAPAPATPAPATPATPPPAAPAPATPAPAPAAPATPQ